MSMTLGVGTPAYFAPELLVDEEYGPPVDVFAFGVVVFELVVGKRAFTGRTPMAVQNKISSGYRPLIPPDLPQLTRNLIDVCWRTGPATRPTFNIVCMGLKEGNYEVLPGVVSDRVKAYVERIESLEKACVKTSLPKLRLL
jgi:serine/threonine protein kinase